jgi:hypothetical protein
MLKYEHMRQLFDPTLNIITLLGIESLPEEQRLALLEDATSLVERRMTVRLMETLDNAALAEAEKFADKPDKLFAFLASREKEFPLLVEEEVMRVREELLQTRLDSEAELKA